MLVKFARSLFFSVERVDRYQACLPCALRSRKSILVGDEASPEDDTTTTKSLISSGDFGVLPPVKNLTLQYVRYAV